MSPANSALYFDRIPYRPPTESWWVQPTREAFQRAYQAERARLERLRVQPEDFKRMIGYHELRGRSMHRGA